MSKNKGLGLVSALAVGAGVAAVAVGKKYKTAETKKKEDYDALHNTSEYRNTERGKYEKNSKGSRLVRISKARASILVSS